MKVFYSWPYNLLEIFYFEAMFDMSRHVKQLKLCTFTSRMPLQETFF